MVEGLGDTEIPHVQVDVALARAFVTDAAERTGRKVGGVTPAAAHQLLRYGWPGNVRELQNAIERAVGGNRSQAARKLGIGEATLYRKIKQFGDA